MFEARESRKTEIDAPIDVVYVVITDFEKYPEWASSLQKVVVHDSAHPGIEPGLDSSTPGYHSALPSEVEFFGGAIGFRARYKLRYEFDPPTEVRWCLVDGEVRGVLFKLSISSLEGSYVFEPTENGKTLATYTLRVALPAPLGPLRRKAEEIVMETGLKDLKRRAESLARHRGDGSEDSSRG